MVLDGLDKEIAALQALFAGRTTKRYYDEVVDIPIDEPISQQVVARFAPQYGLVDKKDLSGAPIYVNVEAVKRPATQSDADTFIVVTEPGILHQMAKDNPSKRFIPAPPSDSTCGCNDCSYMKLVTLDKMYAALRDETPEVVIEESIRRRAERSIRNMRAANR